MKRTVFGLVTPLVVLILLIPISPAFSNQIKVGGKCSHIGEWTSLSNGTQIICKKASNGKLTYVLGHVSQVKPNGARSTAPMGSISSSTPNLNALPKCSNTTLLNTVPVDLSKFTEIIPLGSIDPPDHAIPTDHIYFSYFNGGDSANLVSPGKIVVTSVMNSGETIMKNGVSTPISNDYAIYFSPCKGTTLYFGHVGSLSGKFNQLFKSAKLDQPCQHNTPAPGEQTFYCWKSMDVALSPGEPLGIAGGEPAVHAFDFGARVDGYADPGFVRPERSPSGVAAVCPLDYFDAASKSALYAKILRKGTPRCGQVGQDVKGTAQGDWYSTTDIQKGLPDWSTNLSLVHNNRDPSLGELGVAGVITNPKFFIFIPTHSGTINREPSEVTSGPIYCYQDDAHAQNPAIDWGEPTGSFLIQMIDGQEMNISFQTSQCSEPYSFVSPTKYYR